MTAINQPLTIINNKPGHQIPREFLETALRRCPTVSGFAVQDVTDGVKSLETEEFDRSVTADNLMALNEKTEPYPFVLFLGNFTGKWAKEDIQPFTIQVQDEGGSGGKSIIAFFLEGDFPKFSKDNGHTDEYNFAHEIIIPMIEEYFEAVDGDIGKLTAKLHSPLFEKNVMAHVGHRAAFVFLPLEGDPISFGQNELGQEFEWGTVSQLHDYGKQKPTNPITTAAAAVVNGAKKFTLFKKTEERKTADGQPLPDGVHEVPKPAQPHPDAKPEKKDVQLPAPKTETGRTKVEITVPPQLQGDAKNAWIRLFNSDKLGEPGELPKNHQQKNLKLWVYPEMVPYAEVPCSTKQSVRELAVYMKTGKVPSPVDMKEAAPKPVEDKKDKPVASGQPPITKPSAGDFIPSMTDEEMTEQTGILASLVDRDKVPSALEIQKMEAPWPTYSEKMGIPFVDILRYRVDDFMKLCKGHKPSVMLILEFRKNLLMHMTAEKLKDLIGTAAAETVKHVKAKEIMKPASPSPAEVAAPKKNILGLKKAS